MGFGGGGIRDEGWRVCPMSPLERLANLYFGTLRESKLGKR